MANYKRHRPKLHLFKMCCWEESYKCTGNGRDRLPTHDLRKPQFYHEDEHKNHHPWRYKNSMLE